MAATKKRPVQAPKTRRPQRTGPSAALWAALAAVALALVVAAAVVATRGGGDDPIDATATNELLAGIPQDGAVLGDPDAPITIVEYADLQCPFCAQFSATGFRQLVETYVRPGTVKLEFRGLAFVGEDSTEALRAALAAARQDRLWHFVHILYAHQGEENSGWVTEDLLRRVAAAAGADADRVLAEASSDAVTEALDEDERQARADGIQGTPSFTIGRSGGPTTLIGSGALELDSFRPAVEALLEE